MKCSTKRSHIVWPMVLLGVLMSSCSQSSQGHYPSSYLVGCATILESLREEWTNQNKPPGFDVSQFSKPRGTYFNFTNAVSAGGRSYKCMFGARQKDWPPGVLAITDDGVILWIRDRDGQVTLAPEVNGIEW
jgi:hypothetical protein